jgi:capsular polysaccharide biosynthesis protein
LEQRPAGLAERFQVLRHHWLLVVVATTAVTLVAVAYSLRQGTTYSASSRIVIRPVLIGGTSTAQDRLGAVIDPFGLTALIETQAQLLLGQEVAEHVEQRLPDARSELVTVEGEAVTDDILEITTTSSSPRAAVRMANAYAAAFIDMRQDVVRRGLEAAVADLDRSLGELEDRRETLLSLIVQPTGSDPEAIRAELASLAEQIDEITGQRDDLLFDLDTISGGGAIVSSAEFASSSGPATLRDGVVALVLGLMLGVVLALLRGSVDRRLYTPQDVVDATDTQILAAIPRPRARRRRRPSGVVVRSGNRQPAEKAATNRNDGGVELWLPATSASALAAVRASLVTRGLGSRYRTVTLLSPEPGQGSAVAAGGIAWACATFGFRTIVVDGAGLDESDRILAVPVTRGLVQVLNGSALLKDVLIQTSVPGLRLLPPGRPWGQALDVLGSHDPRQLMEQLTRIADVIVIRSPAVSSGGDPVTWMSVSDAVVLVVRAGASKPVMAQRASQVARSLEVPLLGTILMDADRHDGTVDGAVFANRLGRPPVTEPVEGNGAKASPATDDDTRPTPAASSVPTQASGTQGHGDSTARRRHR